MITYKSPMELISAIFINNMSLLTALKKYGLIKSSVL